MFRSLLHHDVPAGIFNITVYVTLFITLYATVDSVIMVVGAGRGPLVDAALKAARSTERTIRVYAVEKNPGAIVT